MDDGLSDDDVFGSAPVQQPAQGGQNPNISAGVSGQPLASNPAPQTQNVNGPEQGLSDADVFGGADEKQPNSGVNKKSGDLAHSMALLEKAPPLPVDPDKDSFGEFAGKTAINQGLSLLPYFFDKNPDLSTGQQVADVAKSGASSVGKAGAAMFTLPFDAGTHAPAALHNAEEWADNKVSGRAPNYVDYPPSATGYVFDKLDYQPQTAAGERIGAAANLLGPAAAEKALGAASRVATLPGKAADVAGTMKSGWQLPKGQELQDASTDLYNGTNDTYRAMRQNGAVYNPDSIEELRQRVNGALNGSDIIPELRPETTKAVAAINDAADNGELSLNHLDQYRRLLRNASGEDAAAAGSVRKAIDNHVAQTDGTDLMNGSPDAVALLQRGRAEYTRAANFDDVSTLLQKANGDPTKIKNMLNTFLSKDENTMGMTQDEIASLRRASQTTSGEAMTKMLGKAGFTILPTNAQGNGILPYLMAAGENGAKGGALFLPHGPGLVAAGTAARAGNTLYGRGLANDALNMIKNREIPPMPGAPPGTPQLEAPPVYGGPPDSGGAAAAQPQRLLPRGNEDTYYQPQGRSLTYQPRADFEVTPDGFAQKPSDVAPPAKRPVEGAIMRRAGENTADRNVKRLMITHQPRSDFVATDNGIAQPPSDRVGALLGEDQDMPIDAGELQAMRGNPKWPQQNRGGAINKKKGGAVYKRPTSYPAIEEMRKRA